MPELTESEVRKQLREVAAIVKRFDKRFRKQRIVSADAQALLHQVKIVVIPQQK